MIKDRNEYLSILKQMPITCVDIIIICEDKYLILKRNEQPAKDQWWFCGGRIFKNETMYKAAIRKAKEETGLDVVPRKLVDVNETIFDNGPEGIQVHSINIVYLVHSHKSDVILDKGHSEYRWVSISEIPQELDERLKTALQLCFGDV